MTDICAAGWTSAANPGIWSDRTVVSHALTPSSLFSDLYTAELMLRFSWVRSCIMHERGQLSIIWRRLLIWLINWLICVLSFLALFQLKMILSPSSKKSLAFSARKKFWIFRRLLVRFPVVERRTGNKDFLDTVDSFINIQVPFSFLDVVEWNFLDSVKWPEETEAVHSFSVEYYWCLCHTSILLFFVSTISMYYNVQNNIHYAI